MHKSLANLWLLPALALVACPKKPVQQPEGAEILQIRIKAVVGQEERAERGGSTRHRPTSGGRVILKDLEGVTPIPDGSHHVLTDAEANVGIGA